MRRGVSRSALAALALALPWLAGCGGEHGDETSGAATTAAGEAATPAEGAASAGSADAGDAAGSSADAGPSAGTGSSAGVPERAELAARATALGTPLDLVYALDVPGFALARQSVGPAGDDGFQATWVSDADGRLIHLMVEDLGRPDADLHYDDGVRGFVRTEEGRTVTVDADPADVPRDVLREAAESAHPAGPTELAEILPEPQQSQPVERGDLPPEGDGAPLNPEGASG
ncbi:hypothetical protein [Streptomyces hoynatensis]|uniref:Membrane lipoprotein n=1 Tax=Streptomyces hoynatensis TaxID=1141874 RepID=A0A3A9ZFM3_9ACTN|nr:hypothetical protein [Streptomyces hoynatensis]RKN47138.1 hypothetical protein D7294_02900 [Streptomyces hoynatensis]